MADQLITLRPNRGAEIEFDGSGLPYRLDPETDWGEGAVDASLLEGPDITGAVAGTRRLLTRERSLIIQVRGSDAADYLDAAEALAACISNIQRYGGTIVRQLALGSGADASEPLECEILEARLSEASNGWMEAHRLSGEVVLNLTTQPQWLADWESVASVSASTASLIECPVDALRGNLPGPGRIVFTDNASTARRFVELGGAFENYVSGQQTEFRAGASGGDFDLTGADGSAVTTAVTDRIGTHTIAVSPVLPAWTTAAFLTALPQTGSHNVRARVLCEDEDVTVTVRALWRSGSGAWKELESADIPANGWWDLSLGTISHYDEAETIDVRFDVRATEVTSSTFRLNIATVTATDLYVVARGQTTEGVVGGASGYDDTTVDDTDMVSRTAQLGGAWTSFGSGDHFEDSGKGYQDRGDQDAFLKDGRGYVLASLSATVTQTVQADVEASANGSSCESVTGPIFRYVDATNWGLAAVRLKRTSSGKIKRFIAVYKCVGGTLTVVQQHSIPGNTGAGERATISVSVGASGQCVVNAQTDNDAVSFNVTDSVFATAGALDDGKMGFYGASTSSNGVNAVYSFAGFGEVAQVITPSVIRDDGIGEITYANAFSSEANGSDPQPVSSAEGRRIWFVPGLEGQLTAKVRTSDSDAETDTGYSNSTDVDVYHRPAFATLSDSLAA